MDLLKSEQIPIWPTNTLGRRPGYKEKCCLLRVCRNFLQQPILSMLTCFSRGNHNEGSCPTQGFPCLTLHDAPWRRDSMIPISMRTNVFFLYHSNLCTSINDHAWFKQIPGIKMGLPPSEPLGLNQVLFSALNSLFPETYVLCKTFSAYMWK